MIDISVVIPLYNKAPYILRAIHSVSIQAIHDMELIVVDDGSTDNGPDIVRNVHDSRLKLIQQENKGVSEARNAGIRHSRGRIIAFLDADDEWKPDFLKRVMTLVNKYPQTGLYAAAYEKMLSNGSVETAKLKFIPPQPWEGIMPNYFKAAAFGTPPVCSSAVCIPRSVLDKVGMFRIGRRMGEDLDLWARIALCYPIAYSTMIGAIYHEETENRACNVKFTEADEHPFVESYKTFCNKQPTALNEKDINLYIGRLKLENARQHVLSGNYKRARQMLSCGVCTPSRIRKFLWGSRMNRLTYYAWRLKDKPF
jgi:glycosyltransferase involved in cell wall biosynthesis